MTMFVRTRKNVLLIELIIVILFFAISAAITLQVYSHAYVRGQESAMLTQALVLAQDWADRIALSDDPEAMLEQSEWAKDGEGYRLEAQGDLTMTLTTARYALPSGEISRVEISVYGVADEEEEGGEDPLILTLPVESYLPGWGVG